MSKPNILLLIVDSLRVDHLSCYGYAQPTTPSIDELAASSVLFSRAISPSGWTLPVFASILTGTYPSKNGIGQYLENLLTIMEVLRPQGYKSLVVTDSDFVQPLCTQSDDLVYVTVDQVTRMARSKNVTVLLDLLGSALAHKSVMSLRSFAPNFLKNKLAKNWIRKECGSAPWFAMVHYDVHWPYHPPKDFRGRFLNPQLKKEIEAVRRDVYELISTGDLDGKIEVLKSLYDAQIAWVDACIGDLLNQLKSLGILDSTITIVTSDHGDLLGEHGLLHHEFVLYEPLIRVPLIVRFPDQLKERTNADLVQTIDILPTLIDYLGVDQPKVSQQIQGKSLLKILGNADHRDFTISERADWSSTTSRRKLDNLSKKYPSYDWKKYAHELIAVRTEDYKYIWSSEGRDELYNLERDPQELVNLVAVEDQKRRELRDNLDMWRSSFVPAPNEFESSITKRLRAIGYL